MQAVETTSPGKIALRQGLIYGLGLTVIEFIQSLINAFVKNGTLNTILAIVVFIIALAAYALSGYNASRQTGKVGTGALAGFYTGLISGLIGLVYTLILYFAFGTAATTQALQNANTTGSGVSTSTLQTVATVTAVVVIVVGALLNAGIGAGVGAIGGAIGKNKAPVPAQPENLSQQPY